MFKIRGALNALLAERRGRQAGRVRGDRVRRQPRARRRHRRELAERPRDRLRPGHGAGHQGVEDRRDRRRGGQRRAWCTPTPSAPPAPSRPTRAASTCTPTTTRPWSRVRARWRLRSWPTCPSATWSPSPSAAAACWPASAAASPRSAGRPWSSASSRRAARPCTPRSRRASRSTSAPTRSPRSALGASRIGGLALAAYRVNPVSLALVSDKEIIAARDRLWEEFRLAVEPAAATVFAAWLSGQVPGAHPCLVLSGANATWTPA